MMMFDGQHSAAGSDGTEIVPARQRASRPNGGWLWFVGIGLSVAVMARYPMLGVACLAMGLRTQSERFGAKGLVAGLGISGAVLVAWMVLDGVSNVLFAVPLVGIAAAISALMWKGRAGVTEVSLVVTAAIALCMAVDGFTAFNAGTNLAEVTSAMLMEVARASVGRGVEAELALVSIEPLISVIWPMVYVLSAALDALGAGFGSFLGSVQRPASWGEMPAPGQRLRVPQISLFDAPLWAVGVLALSVLGMGASFAAVPESQILRTVSVTLFLAVRIIFLIQGLGVILGLLGRWHIGCFGRFAVIMVATWLEVMFVVSIIGLIDVWANFRKLPRDGSHNEAHT